MPSNPRRWPSTPARFRMPPLARYDLAALHRHITNGKLGSEVAVLLDEHDRQTLASSEVADDAAYVLEDARLDTFGRLVEDHELRAGGQRTGDAFALGNAGQFGPGDPAFAADQLPGGDLEREARLSDTACSPRALRSARMCWCKAFSTTTTPGQAASKSSSLVTSSPRALTSAPSRSSAILPTVIGLPSRRSSRSARSSKPSSGISAFLQSCFTNGCDVARTVRL